MVRGFKTHEIRRTEELDGLWNVEILEGTGAVTRQERFTMMVPGCVQSLPGLGNFRGKCRFTKQIEVKEEGHVKLTFFGVSFMAEIFWDGRKAADHYNAFTEFEVVLPDQKAGWHCLELLVDNSWNEEVSALHVPNDYQSYNGITRPVEMARVPDWYIDWVHMTPVWNAESETWSAAVDVRLEHVKGAGSRAEREPGGEERQSLVFELCGVRREVPLSGGTLGEKPDGMPGEKPDEMPGEKPDKMPGGMPDEKPDEMPDGTPDKMPNKRLDGTPEGTWAEDSSSRSNRIYRAVIDVPDAKSWEVLRPALYFLKVQLKQEDQIIDDRIERAGFRRVSIEGRKILLNGKRIFPQGFCRHEDHPEFGCSLPVEEMARDILLLLDMGCNSVRTTHYPNDQRFLDLCDEYGILVWEENHARGLDEEHMRHVNFDSQCAMCNEAMVTRHYNHPSIYVWGILNECASETEYGFQCYERQFLQIKAMDRSRPVTFSSCRNFKDISFGLVDIVSMNVYPGWYHDTPPGKWVDDLEEWIETTGGAGKPFILSEFGAGAVYGFHDYDRVKWSEERQADILRAQLEAFLERDFVSGTYIWQFCDNRVSEEIMRQRPKTQNNKGIVDGYRRPKLAYGTVKELYGNHSAAEEE